MWRAGSGLMTSPPYQAAPSASGRFCTARTKRTAVYPDRAAEEEKAFDRRLIALRNEL